MRIQRQNIQICKTFSKRVFDIGDGKVTKEETGCIKLPDDFCTIIDSQGSLINLIFPNVLTQYIHREWLAEWAILAAKNVDVSELNLKIQQILPGILVTYKSVVAVCDPIEAANFPTEFLNSLDLPGIPPHNLALIVGSPVILLQSGGFQLYRWLRWDLAWNLIGCCIRFLGDSHTYHKLSFQELQES
ncbi:uncharacterized protein [Parasteatoda tepidariorum]|uniref:uncharacterized protein n=1 Tax=Parasteatoda tepidariorum TaxID=114398 RepID=UPI0039BD18F3